PSPNHGVTTHAARQTRPTQGLAPAGSGRWRDPIEAGFRSVGVLARLDQLHEDAARVLGVDEVHAGAGGAVLRDFVEQADATLAQGGADLVDVVDPVGHLLDAGA